VNTNESLPMGYAYLAGGQPAACPVCGRTLVMARPRLFRVQVWCMNALCHSQRANYGDEGADVEEARANLADALRRSAAVEDRGAR
jgi:hypothetical protein